MAAIQDSHDVLSDSSESPWLGELQKAISSSHVDLQISKVAGIAVPLKVFRAAAKMTFALSANFEIDSWLSSLSVSETMASRQRSATSNAAD